MEDRRHDAASTDIGRCILVPVANPASVRPLLEIASHLVSADGCIELLTVLPPDAGADAQADAWQGMASAEAMATRLGVAAHGEVRTHPALGDAVISAVHERGASLVLMGWRGATSTTDVFGRLIDHVVGRSAAPLAVVRFGAVPHERVVLPVSADHLLPGGGRGLALAVALAHRLGRDVPRPTTVLRTGARAVELPATVTAIADRVHHDPRRTHQAVAALAHASDLIVAAVAPTVSGLRAATTHLAWAAPDATLLVAIDVGPRGERSLAAAVAGAGRPAPPVPPPAQRPTPVRVVVTARPPEGSRLSPQQVERVLAGCGRTDQLMAWWPAGDSTPRVRVTVEQPARDPDRALAQLMAAVDAAPELAGAEISYEFEHTAGTRATGAGIGVRSGELSVLTGDLDQPTSTRHTDHAP